MDTMSPESLNGFDSDDAAMLTEGSQGLNSPFARNDLIVSEARSPDRYESFLEMTSPFTESFTTVDEESMEAELMETLLSELEDEEFTEALEALATEAAGRYMNGGGAWSQESGVPVVDPTDTEQWMESIAAQADMLLAELEERFIDRTADSVTDEELDQVMEHAFPQLESLVDPLDAQELFFGKLKKKLKKIKNLVKKGVKLASKFMPLGIIYRRLRPIIRPLLNKVLAKAIGKLPKSLQEPARKLAQKYGLKPAAEFESDFEILRHRVRYARP